MTTIPIFPKEIEDGISEQLSKDNCVAFLATCRPTLNTEEIIKASANLSDIDSFDLFPFESVLCSTGMNDNDDVFLAEEMWKAKCSPIHKKINFLHNEKDIIGHMVSTRAIDREGMSLSYELPDQDVPKGFDLVSGGVLYKVWDEEDLQARMNELITGMETGKWFVSMECLFPNFDYGLLSSSGQQYIIPRNAETAMLSKHLRRYGGSGQYETYKIGRVLRNITFSGKGIVDNPANKRSVILKSIAEFNGASASIDIFTTENKTMADTVAKQDYDTLAEELKTLRAEAKVASEKATEKQIADAKAQASKFESELAASKAVAQAHEDKVKTLEAEVKLVNEKLVTANTELEAAAKETLKAKRLSMFADVEIDAAKAQELVEKFIGASDEMFNELVTAMPKKIKTEAKVENKTVETALSTAKVEETVVTVPAVDATKETRTKASAWISEFLKTSVKNK